MIQKKLWQRSYQNIFIAGIVSFCYVFSPYSDRAYAIKPESPSIAINQGGNLHRSDSQGYIKVNIGEPYEIEITPHFDSAVIIKIDGVLVTGDNISKRLLCIDRCRLERPFAVAKRFTVLQEGNPGLGRDGGVNNPNLGLIEVTFMPMRRRVPLQKPAQWQIQPEEAQPQLSESLYRPRPATLGSTIRSTDWEYTSLRYLNERYGCIAGSSRLGAKESSRYEFAAGLNACLDKINEIISAGLADKVSKRDVAILQNLQEVFASELAMFRGRVDALEAKSTQLQAQQFSTTTKLNGTALFAPSAGKDRSIETVPARPSATIPVKPIPVGIVPVGTGFSGESAQRFQLSTEWVDAPELAAIVTKKYRLVGIRQEPLTLQNMGKPDQIVDPTPPRVRSSH